MKQLAEQHSIRWFVSVKVVTVGDMPHVDDDGVEVSIKTYSVIVAKQIAHTAVFQVSSLDCKGDVRDEAV